MTSQNLFSMRFTRLPRCLPRPRTPNLTPVSGDTAARLLYERQDRTAIPLLKKLATESTSALGRMHSLYALDGLHGLALEDPLVRLDDNDEVVRAHAVRLSERVLPRDTDSPTATSLRTKLHSLADDPSIRVRYQLAFTLGEVVHASAFAAENRSM